MFQMSIRPFRSDPLTHFSSSYGKKRQWGKVGATVEGSGGGQWGILLPPGHWGTAWKAPGKGRMSMGGVGHNMGNGLAIMSPRPKPTGKS